MIKYKQQDKILLQIFERKGVFMKRLRKLALMCAACIAFTGSVAAFPDKLITSVIANAEDGEEITADNIIYQVYSDHAMAVGLSWDGSWGDGETIKLDILSEINGVPVTSIDDEAFDRGYFIVSSLTIPDSVTSIGEDAFDGKDEVIAISIGSGITDISELEDPLSSSRLQSITVSPDNPNYSSANNVLFNKEKTELISFPKSKKGKYSIPETVSKISDYAFSRCTGLSLTSFTTVLCLSQSS